MNSMNSDADRWKNGTLASPATARASSVLPVPGGAGQQHALRDRRAEPRCTCPGLRRKSTISASSFLTSSMPATSANVVRGPCSGSYRLARDRPIPPSPPSPPPAAAIRRKNQMPRPMNSSVGPKPTRICVSSDTWSGGLALTVTFVVEQQLGQPVVAEGRPLGGEVGDVLGVAVVRRVFRRLAEGALDRVAGRGDLADVAGLHLVAEERVRHGRPGRAHQGRGDDPVDDQRQQDEPPGAPDDAAPVGLGAAGLAARAAGRGALDLPGWPVGRPVPVGGPVVRTRWAPRPRRRLGRPTGDRLLARARLLAPPRLPVPSSPYTRANVAGARRCARYETM